MKLKPTEAWALARITNQPPSYEIALWGTRRAPNWQYRIYPSRKIAEQMRDSADEIPVKVGITLTDLAGYAIEEARDAD